MRNDSLYNVARQYLEIIESLENERNKDQRVNLEEERVLWHNRLIELLQGEGILFKDREHVTCIAYRIIRDEL
jgi:hypothetical protein